MIRSFSPNAKRYLAFTAFNAVAWNAFSLTFNLYVHSLGYRQDFIGLLNGLPSIVILICGLPIGMAAERYGYLRFLVAGCILNALAALGMGLSSARFGLLAFAVLGGIGASLSWVIGAPMLMTLSTKEERVFLFAVQAAVMTGMGFLGNLMAGALPEVAAGMMGTVSTATAPLRLSYLVGASFNLLAVLPILRMTQVKGNGGGGPSAVGAPGWRRSLPASWGEFRLFVKLLGPSALISFGAGAMVVFFQLFFNLRFNLSPGKIGPLFAFSALVTGAATLVSPILAKRLGKVRTVVATQMASIPFLLLLAYSYNLAAVTTAYYVRNALMNMSSPVQQTFVLEQVQEGQRATLTSLSAMLGSLGRAGLGPIVSGYLQVKSGFTPAFTMTTVCYVISTGMFYLFFRRAELLPGRGLRASRGLDERPDGVKHGLEPRARGGFEGPGSRAGESP